MERFTEKHYRVVRYYPHYGHGIMRDVLATDLSLNEAEALADRHRGLVAKEDVVIQDQTKTGLEAEVLVEPESDHITQW